MKVLSFAFAFAAGLYASLALGQAQPATAPWWNGGRPPGRGAAAAVLPRISVKGNRFVTPDGKPILFRGVSIADPDKIEGEGHWNRDLFVHVQELGANLVRIPVHPVAWRQRTPAGYLRLLDQAVRWCGEMNMHVIIDWHSIGNLEMELFQNPMYNTSRQETYEFWRTIATHYHGNTTVAFYELFNEPTSYRGQLGNVTWGEWKTINENMIHLIRAYDPDTVELVAGFDWAYDLTPLREEPIAAAGIGYVTHPYPNKRTQPWEPKWEEDFGFAADAYPLIATEIGFNLRAGQAVRDDDYGNLITRYLEKRNISWMAWVYDPQWGPQMLKSWNFDLTGAGDFFKMAMHREVATNSKEPPPRTSP